MSNEIKQIEELVELYIDQSIARPPVKMYRLDIEGDRVYYYFDEKGEPVFKQSVTSVIARNTPTSPGLIKWYADQGMEAATDHRDTRAAFGTFMHICLEKFLLNGEYDLDRLDEDIDAYAEMERLPADFGRKHSREAKKSILGFAAFCNEHKVKPVAVEISLASKQYQVAGMLDLACEMVVKEKGFFGEKYKTGPRKGKPKETTEEITIRAMVDFKSGKNFYDDHAMQLEIYRRIWNENFPEYQIDRIFNWAPSDWRSAPTFKLKDQTSVKCIKKVGLILDMNEIDQQDKNRRATIFKGTVRRDTDFSDNIETVDYRDFVKAKKKESDEKKSD